MAEVLILFAMVIALLMLGVPVGVSIGLSSIVFLLIYSDGSLTSIANTLFDAFHGHYTLLAIPFFILAAAFMSTGGVAQRIIRFAIACVGHLPGGLAIAGVFACMLFAALSGSSPATVVAVGSIVIAGMTQAGYPKEFGAGVVCNAGTLGILLPPSIVMVVYASTVDVSVGRMFLAGVVPGVIAGGMLMVAIYAYARWKKLARGEWAGWREIGRSGADAFWGLMLVVVVLGGIWGGVFTPTEAAAMAAVYAFVVANFIYRDMGPLKAPAAHGKPAMIKERAGKADTLAMSGSAAVLGGPGVGGGGAPVADDPNRPISLLRKPQALLTAWVHKDTQEVLYDAGKITITLMFIIANALILKHVLTEEQLPQHITQAMLSWGLGPVTFLIVVNLILLIGGQFMEPSGLIVIVAPLVFPIAMQLGIDPIHLGIIMVVNMEIGMITPPVGLNLFVTSGVANMSMLSVVKAALPWLGVLIIFLIMVTYIPAISTWLPTMMMGPETVMH
ncbi:TRAP transporter large permease [Altericroceibacterium endophyticum]|uniref:TRAP transporter large permease protein n=1 Tax=Altericroceibacterium endophyticum TaxID=1808508 RepID=A0A6I4T4E1_9SPHN|nr:TRAP transporter large permease [Altericroceibacterium endophyticum]MXO64810.1 TRAP transporter large permease subunit [Altericroceibacterium endophyticum]